MVDRRIPGVDPNDKPFKCSIPGCERRESASSAPDCPKHMIPMVPAPEEETPNG